MRFCTRAFGFAHILILAVTVSGLARAAEKVTVEQIQEFTAKLQELQRQPAPIDPKVAAALAPLNVILDLLSAPDVAATDKAAKVLVDTLPRFGVDHAALAEKGALRKVLDDARAAIEGTERVSELLRLEARAGRLAAALTAFKETSKPPLTETLATLKTAISAKINTTFGIHIVYARIGDLRFSNDRRRTCNAVGYFRELCNKKSDCQLKTGDTIDGICGYEPAPFAEERNRGAVIGYRCVTATETGWQHLFASDATGDKDVRRVQLQGKAIFHCDKPDPKATAQAGAEPKTQ